MPELLEREQDPARGRARDPGEVGDLAERQRRALAREHLDDGHPALERLQRLLAIAIGGTVGLRRLAIGLTVTAVPGVTGAGPKPAPDSLTHMRSLRAQMGTGGAMIDNDVNAKRARTWS